MSAPDALTLYSFIDADHQEFGSWTTRDHAEAKAYAREHGLLIVENEYAWADSQTLEDFRPTKPTRREDEL